VTVVLTYTVSDGVAPDLVIVYVTVPTLSVTVVEPGEIE
jgi:hypothetical protein